MGGGGRGQGGRWVRAVGTVPAGPHLLTVTGQEHGPVHQVLQSLPEQLAGGQGGLQVQQALQHGQQLGGRWGAAHLGGGGWVSGSTSACRERPPHQHSTACRAPVMSWGHGSLTVAPVTFVVGLLSVRGLPCALWDAGPAPVKPIVPSAPLWQPSCLWMFLDAPWGRSRLDESHGFFEGQKVPAREGLSWTRDQPPGLLLVLGPLRPFGGSQRQSWGPGQSSSLWAAQAFAMLSSWVLGPWLCACDSPDLPPGTGFSPLQPPDPSLLPCVSTSGPRLRCGWGLPGLGRQPCPSPGAQATVAGVVTL